jgi:hypothetical protein|tara:strand:- start:9769 stop:10068 length:300 start_codon:yes stop_codon:yes gene_type:complete
MHIYIFMPYIREDKRKQIESELDQLVIKFLETQDEGGTAGRLNYVISSMIGAILKNDRLLSYARINELIGVLECAKMELYRRVAAPYEDDKSRLNGDVY